MRIETGRGLQARREYDDGDADAATLRRVPGRPAPEPAPAPPSPAPPPVTGSQPLAFYALGEPLAPGSALIYTLAPAPAPLQLTPVLAPAPAPAPATSSALPALPPGVTDAAQFSGPLPLDAPPIYRGEPGVDPAWLAARGAAFAGVQADYGAARAQALSTPGIGPAWVPATVSTDESGQQLRSHPIVVLRIADPLAASESADWLGFDEATFAGQYQAQARARAGAPLQTLAALYATDAASLLAEHPGLWDIALAASAHPVNAGPPPPGRAMGDAAQLWMLDQYMADPQVAALITAYGGEPAAPSSPLALEQVRLYGAQRTAQMARLESAMESVRGQYLDALLQAGDSGNNNDASGWIERPRSFEPHYIDDTGALVTPDPALPATERVFDQHAYTAWYIAQSGLQHQAFASFYGQSHSAQGATSFDNPNWSLHNNSEFVHHALVGIDLDDAPRLHDQQAVGYDLQLGWATAPGNIRQSRDWIEVAVPLFIVGLVSYASANTLGPATASALGLTETAAVAGTAVGLTATGVVVSAAVTGAAASLASGLMAGNVSFAGVLRGALSGALTSGLSSQLGPVVSAAGGDTAGAIAVRATVQGGVQALLGGKFADGAMAGLASGLADAAVAHLRDGIALALEAETMTPAQAAAASDATRIIGSAIRALGRPDDPAAGFAGALLDDLMATAGPVPVPPGVVTQTAFDADGNLLPGIVDTGATPAQQALQLAEHFQRQGMDGDAAAALALQTVGQSLGAGAAAGDRTAVAVEGDQPAAASQSDSGTVVTVTTTRLPRDALGNQYDTDSSGRQVVYLAGGGMLTLAATAAVPISGGSALPGLAALGRLAIAAGPLALLALIPVAGNAGQGFETIEREDGTWFVRRQGELYGHVFERTPGGQWMMFAEAYAGFDGAAGFEALTDAQIAARRRPITTPATPQPPQSAPPLPAFADKPEVLPGYAEPAPAAPTLGGLPAHPTSPDELVIYKTREERHDDAVRAWDANRGLRHPDDLIGESDGGPGRWDLSGLRAKGAAYQEEVSGVPRGVEYKVAGVDFDHYDATRHVLVDAKDWGSYVLPDKKFWVDSVVDTALVQIRALSSAGTDATIEWHVSTAEAASAVRATLTNASIEGIRVVVVPKKGP